MHTKISAAHADKLSECFNASKSRAASDKFGLRRLIELDEKAKDGPELMKSLGANENDCPQMVLFGHCTRNKCINGSLNHQTAAYNFNEKKTLALFDKYKTGK